MKFLSIAIKKLGTLLPFLNAYQSLRIFLGFALCIAVNACLTNTVKAEEAVSPWAVQFGVGVGSHQTRKADFAAIWDPQLNWLDNGAWHFSIVGEAHLAQWRVLHTTDVTEVGFTPVFLYSKNAGPIAPYVEAGIGIRLLSRARITDHYTLSSAFQFTEMVGIGATFGTAMHYKIGLRLQHLSNASIKMPNPGINFAETFIQYNF